MTGNIKPSGQPTTITSSTKKGKNPPIRKKKPKNTPADDDKPPRIRTKTGCLTCRRRRIKCGEEKPICAHCIKSRRVCEGYNPNIIFRRDVSLPEAPTAPSRTPQALPTQQVIQFDQTPHFHDQVANYGPAGPLPVLHPTPTYPHGFVVDGFDSAGGPNGFDLQNEGITSALSSFLPNPYLMSAPHHPPMQPWNPGWELKSPVIGTYATNTGLDQYANEEHPAFDNHATAGMCENEEHPFTEHPIIDVPYHYRQQLEYNHVVVAPAEGFYFQPSENSPYSTSLLPTPSAGLPDTNQILEDAAIENVDDGYFDCYSDEELDNDEDEEEFFDAVGSAAVASKDQSLGAMAALYRQVRGGQGLNSHDAFLAPGVIDHYRPERVANPLNNEATARVFNHFITSTGPMLSVFERRMKSTEAVSREDETSVPQQSTWSYTLPMMALHDQGVLHAMLALSSLHIAKLQGASTTPSFKHYAYALKKIRRAVATQERRHQITTLAATLLIAFYEVMTAAHVSWSTLLVGAKQLISEVDFIGTTRRLRAWKIKRAMEIKHSHVEYALAYGSIKGPSLPQDAYLGGFEDVDMGLLATFCGAPIPYAEYGAQNHDQPNETFTESQLRDCEVLQDLYWWYCRQDMIHALISGDDLLMDFSKWSYCSPRAPMGVELAVYGSYDHLVILLARSAQFIASDRSRKMKATRFPQMPFYGMAPASNTRTMPRGFAPDHSSSASEGDISPVDLDTATTRALEEWNHLKQLYIVFAQRLGHNFQPLSLAEYQPLDTPFGPGVLYRTYDIALLWMTYYMGMIIITRGHPNMPPAATAAIGAAARDTAAYATLIGRIGAGIAVKAASSPLNASVSVAFTGTIVPLFTAGLQYQDASHRHWVVSRLREVEARSGWASAGLCALGCETAWTRAAQMGRGPPYEPVCQDEKSNDIRVNGRQRPANEAPTEVNERAYIPYSKQARLQFGFGMLGTEEALDKMSLYN